MIVIKYMFTFNLFFLLWFRMLFIWKNVEYFNKIIDLILLLDLKSNAWQIGQQAKFLSLSLILKYKSVTQC